MKILLLLTLLISAACCKSLVKEFYEAMDKYHGDSPQTLMSDRATEKARFLNFKRYKKEINRINNDDSLPYTAEVNMFSTLTEAERSQYLSLIHI